MSTPTSKPLVLVISGAGVTGVSVLQGLARAGKWVRYAYSFLGIRLTERQRLAASVRPNSVHKPEVSSLEDLGVEIKQLDWQTASAAELDALFEGVDTVISTCYFSAIPDQKLLVDAAKRTGVKRFIPCDFATPAPPGVMMLHDTVSTEPLLDQSFSLTPMIENENTRLPERPTGSVHHCGYRSLDAYVPPLQVQFDVSLRCYAQQLLR